MLASWPPINHLFSHLPLSLSLSLSSLSPSFFPLVLSFSLLPLSPSLSFLSLFLSAVTDEDTVKRYYAKFEEKFFQTCEKELSKINTFYSGN